MLTYNGLGARSYTKPQQDFSQQANQLANAINYLATKKTKEQKELARRNKELLAVQASDIHQRYKLTKLDIVNNQDLNPNQKLEELHNLGIQSLEQLEKISGDSKEVYNTYKAIQLDNKDSLYKLRDVFNKQIKDEQKKDFTSKLNLGGFGSLEEARDYNKTLKLGFSELDLVKGFENAGNRRALEFIQQSTIDGIPSELLKFNTRDDVIKSFYKELGTHAKIQKGIINAIASAHKWKLSQIEKAKKEREKKAREAKSTTNKEINALLARLESEVRRANINGVPVPDSIGNSMKLLNGVVNTPNQKLRLENLSKKFTDNKSITAFIQQGFNSGMSKDDIVNKLKGYTSISDTDKMGLINKAFDRTVSQLEDGITSSLKAGDKNSAGQYFQKLYQLDIDTGSKVAGDIIKRELSRITPTTLDSTINALELYINAEQNAGNPTPLLEQTFLNELRGAKSLGARGESQKDLINYLSTKKNEYLERKRTKFLKDLTTKELEIRNQMKDQWLEFDNEATSKDIRNFLINNPDIPTNRVYDAFVKQTTDIDTTDVPFFNDFGKYELSDQIRNGKILIPDDRELGDKSISSYLRSYIPQHSDKFVRAMLKKIDTNTKGYKDIEEVYFTFNKTPNGELQLQVYGTPKGDFNEELLGIINHKELYDFLNKE